MRAAEIMASTAFDSALSFLAMAYWRQRWPAAIPAGARQHGPSVAPHVCAHGIAAPRRCVVASAPSASTRLQGLT